MEWWSVWLAAAPIAGTIILLTPLVGRWRLRARLPWFSAVALLLVSSTFLTQCSSRAVAAGQIEARLFPSSQQSIAIYDVRDDRWLRIAAGPSVEPSMEVHLLSGPTRLAQGARGSAGSASPGDMRAVQLELKGTDSDVAKMREALTLLVNTRYGSAVLADVLQRSDVTIILSDEIGLELPNGEIFTTGGTAITEGKRVTISRSRYGTKSPEVLAAMVAHELTHVAQNLASGAAWWQWPWTTIDRETSAHLMQAVVWAELRGEQRDWEQDSNLENALDRDTLQERIRSNPAYPWWLAPDISC